MTIRPVDRDHASEPDTFSLGIASEHALAIAGDASAAIDLPSLLRRCLDDATFCGMILHKFASRSADQLAALERALDSGNTLELAREAHTLQGVAANLSASRLYSLANVLESAANEVDLPRARRALDNARIEVARCAELIPLLMNRLAL